MKTPSVLTRSTTKPDPASCVVTGGARGIGRGIAEKMIARGHRVVITDIDGDGAAATALAIGAVAGIAQDVRDPESHSAVAAVAAEHGRLTAWFNNAGVGWDGALIELSEEQVRGLVEINVLGVMWGTRAAVAAMSAHGGRSDIVMTASLSGLGPVPGLSTYAATKAAVVSLAMSVDLETPRSIRVHALCPDGVATPMVEEMKQDGLAARLVNSGGGLLSIDEISDKAVALVGSRRVIRTVPTWRGAAMRATSLTPSLAGGALKVFAAQGKGAIKRGSARS
ncbi:hypothetical protein GCM10027020_28610 [Nocardioides salsibiostraticola]